MNERIEFDVIINGKKAKAELKNIEGGTKKLEETTTKSNSVMSESWVTLGLKIAATTVAMKASIAAYEKQFKAETALGAAMNNNKNLRDTNIASWKEYASAIQEWANVGDEVVLQQMSFLNTLGLTDDQMKVIIQTAADVSNAGFMPFDSAVRNLAKSLSGMSGELGELFPVLRDFTAEQLKAGEGITAIGDAVKGQSEAIANSPIGKWNALWNTAGDTFEKVGEKILGIIDSIGVLDFASTVFEQMSFGMDLLGLRFDWIGEKVKQFWNVLTFDTEEANQAQAKANKLTEQYNALLIKSKEALDKKAVSQAKVNTELNLEADSQAKAYEEEMKKVYADELAAMGLSEQGDELERVNSLLGDSASAYGSAATAADVYANSINSLSSTMSAAEQNDGTSGVYRTTTTTADDYVSTLNPYTYTSLYTDSMGNSIDQFGFASGGYTGDIPASSVAGVVHGQEYVVDAQSTKSLGLDGGFGTFNSMDDKLNVLYDINKSLVKMLRFTKDNKEHLERIATA